MDARTLNLDRSALERLATYCKRNNVARLAVFGSAARGTMRPDSDLDVLVEFQPGHTPGLRFFAIQEELSDMLGRPVDLNTPGFLSRYVRAEVLAEAVTLYAA